MSVVDYEARAQINTHEKVCAERYGNLWTAVGELKKQIGDLGVNMSNTNAATHVRFNTISTRMWVAVAAVAGTACVALLGIVGTIGFHLLTRVTS